MQENIRTLTAEIQQLMNQRRGREREPPQDPHRGSGSPPNSLYGSESSTGDARPRRRRVHRDDLKDLRIEAPEFDRSLKPEDYLEWVHGMERMIEIKGYYGEKAFKLAILKLK